MSLKEERRQQKRLWRNERQTKMFLDFLRTEYHSTLQEAQNSAVAGNGEHATRKLIKANTIKEIIDYAESE